MPSKPVTAFVLACRRMDWAQVRLHGGEPCFHIESDGRFCGRARRWDGHSPHSFHAFVTLAAAAAAAVVACEQERQQKCPEKEVPHAR